MKKVLFFLTVLVCFLQLNGFAQKSSVGVTAGITSSNNYGRIGGNLLKDDSKGGITFGMHLHTPLGKSPISFQPSLNYVQKGRWFTKTNELKDWIALRYAELQMNFLYNAGGFYIGGGPYAAIDLPSSKITKSLVRDPVKSDYWLRAETNVNFGQEANSDVKGLDYGANMLTGYRLKSGFSLNFNYSVGIRNLIPIDNGSDNIRNHYFGVSLGYLVSNK